jgi:hypothetical protein
MTSPIALALVLLAQSTNEVRVHDQVMRRGPQAAPGSGSIASTTMPDFNPICGHDELAWDGQAVSGGTLSPLAGFTPQGLIDGLGGSVSSAFVALISGSSRNQGVFLADGTNTIPLAIGCGPGGGGGYGGGLGDPTPIGGTFAGFFLGTFFVPAVNGLGDVVFLADVDDGSSTRALFLFRASTGTIEKLAAVGDAAPGGGTFSAVGPGTINDLQQVIFLASTGAPGAADIYRWQSGFLGEVVQVGDPAPSGGTYLQLGTESLTFSDGTTIPVGPVPDINDLGTVAFRATLSTAQNPQAIVVIPVGQLGQVYAMTGDTSPVGGKYSTFEAPALSDLVEVAFYSDVSLGGGSFTGGWFAGEPGNWRKVLAFGDAVGGGVCNGLAVSRNPMAPLDELGNVLVWTRALNLDLSETEHLVVVASDGTHTIAASQGDATPLGGTYGSMDAWPSLDSYGRGTLSAFVGGATNGALNGHFLFSACPDAAAVPRNGSGTNDLCFTSLSAPVLGSSWMAEVDVSAHAGASFVYVLGYELGYVGFPLSFGELLVDVGSTNVLALLGVPLAGLATVVQIVPNDMALAGYLVSTQAVIFGGGLELCNAYDLTLGY